MPLINCETNLILTWSEKCVIWWYKGNNICKNRYKTLCAVVTLSTQDNAKLLEQLKSGFKRTINWNNYQPKVSLERQN